MRKIDIGNRSDVAAGMLRLLLRRVPRTRLRFGIFHSQLRSRHIEPRRLAYCHCLLLNSPDIVRFVLMCGFSIHGIRLWSIGKALVQPSVIHLVFVYQ